jgi:NADPH:quinone reductase-like Zn-dependent oxidoreductase
MSTMKVAVIQEAGGHAVLKIERRPIPRPQRGELLIRVKAFGFNCSEMFIGQGDSPGVEFPLVLGIEAVGIVEETPGDKFRKGDVIVSAIGGVGRPFNGGYAEYTCLPETQVQLIKTHLAWKTLGAIPGILQTAWNSLFKSLRLEKGESLLIRGGTTSVGLAAAGIAKNHGNFIAATTRNPDRENLLHESGVDEVFIDDGSVAEQIKESYPEKFDKLLELVGTGTLKDSLRCVRDGGIVCMAGVAGGKWSIEDFIPGEAIPTAVCLTTYGGGSEDFMRTPLNDLIKQIESSQLRIKIGKVFHFDEIADAYHCLEGNEGGGKIVVLT